MSPKFTPRKLFIFCTGSLILVSLLLAVSTARSQYTEPTGGLFPTNLNIFQDNLKSGFTLLRSPMVVDIAITAVVFGATWSSMSESTLVKSPMAVGTVSIVVVIVVAF